MRRNSSSPCNKDCGQNVLSSVIRPFGITIQIMLLSSLIFIAALVTSDGNADSGATWHHDSVSAEQPLTFEAPKLIVVERTVWQPVAESDDGAEYVGGGWEFSTVDELLDEEGTYLVQPQAESAQSRRTSVELIDLILPTVDDNDGHDDFLPNVDTTLFIPVSTYSPTGPPTYILTTPQPTDMDIFYTLPPVEAMTPQPVEPITLPPVEPITTQPVEPMTLPPVEPMTPQPVEPMTPQPVEPKTPQPVEPMTLPPVEPMTLPPVEPMTLPPVEPMTPQPVEPMTLPPVEPMTSQPVEPMTLLPTDMETLLPVMPVTLHPKINTLAPTVSETISSPAPTVTPTYFLTIDPTYVGVLLNTPEPMENVDILAMPTPPPSSIMKFIDLDIEGFEFTFPPINGEPITTSLAPSSATPTGLPTYILTTPVPTLSTSSATILFPSLVLSKCSPSSKCSACMGDCDSDNHCATGLQCFKRDDRSSLAVPGCAIGGVGDVAGEDYCFDPNYDAMTVTPTITPPTTTISSYPISNSLTLLPTPPSTTNAPIVESQNVTMIGVLTFELPINQTLGLNHVAAIESSLQVFLRRKLVIYTSLVAFRGFEVSVLAPPRRLEEASFSSVTRLEEVLSSSVTATVLAFATLAEPSINFQFQEVIEELMLTEHDEFFDILYSTNAFANKEKEYIMLRGDGSNSKSSIIGASIAGIVVFIFLVGAIVVIRQRQVKMKDDEEVRHPDSIITFRNTFDDDGSFPNYIHESALEIPTQAADAESLTEDLYPYIDHNIEPKTLTTVDDWSLGEDVEMNSPQLMSNSLLIDSEMNTSITDSEASFNRDIYDCAVLHSLQEEQQATRNSFTRLYESTTETPSSTPSSCVARPSSINTTTSNETSTPKLNVASKPKGFSFFLSSPEKTVYEVRAPPGPLGIVVDSSKDGPIICKM